MTSDTDILQAAFGSERWRSSTDALFEATGLSVAVMDTAACSVIHAVNHCPYCDLGVRRVSDATGGCFDDPPRFAFRGTTETACRGGLPTFITPVMLDGRPVCTIVIGGFVSSTRERKRLFEKLLATGVPEAEARRGVRDIPILPKRQVEAVVRMVVTNATDALERAAERARLEHAVSELEVFVEAGREFTERRGIGQDLLEGVLVKGMAVISADSGSLMLRRPGTDLLEVVAPLGSSTGAFGRIVRFGEGIAGRVAANGRSVLITGESRMAEHSMEPGREISSAVSVPLLKGGEVLGVLNLNISDPLRRLSGEDVRLIERYAHMAAGVIDNARKHRATERAMFELMHLSDLAKMLSGVTSMDEVVSIASSVLEKTFDFDIGGVVIIGWGRDEATVIPRGPVPASAVDHVLSVVAGRDLEAEPLALVQPVAHLGEITADGEFDADAWNVLPVELVVKDNIVGYVFVSGGGGRRFNSDDRRLLGGLADHLALGMDKAAMLHRMRDELTKTIAALSLTLDATAHATPGHSDRVMDYAMALGEEVGLGIDQIELLRFAGLLHDVGTAGISEEILLKPSRLNDVEMAQVREHAHRGADLVEQIDFLNALAPVIMHHHERWDGTGYPMGLAGKDIPFLARVLAIADAFDAMTSASPYRQRLSFAAAREELLQAAGTQFDPALVTVFIEAMDRRALAGASGLMATDRSDEPQLPA